MGAKKNRTVGSGRSGGSKAGGNSGLTTADRDRFVVIMAGGRGERFWPVSREKTPKQLISLMGKRSFLQETVDRVLPLVPARNVFIITNRAQVEAVRKQCGRLPRENIVAEPIGRDTCAAVALGAALVGARSTTGVMAVLPADHVIPEPKKFQRILGDAFDLAARGQVLVTIGIKPTEPATGYGYIRTGPKMPAPKGGRRYRTAFFKAERFKEKPPLETAIEYVDSGEYRWNAGMFIWSFVSITNALDQHQPEMAEACRRWFKAAGGSGLNRVLARDYPAIRKVSVDVALMEKAANVVVADGNFQWDDLGAWTALPRHLRSDPAGNCVSGEMVAVDSARNILFDARSGKPSPIALVGVRDSIVVATDDALLVAAKGEAQKIKELVKKLGKDKRWKRLV